MSSPSNLAYLERLKADNCAMLLIDQQKDTPLGVQAIGRNRFKSNLRADKEGNPGLTAGK